MIVASRAGPRRAPRHVPVHRKTRVQSRSRRWLRRSLTASAAVLAGLTVVAGGLYVITPGVGDAPRRVASILATHDATGVDVSRDSKVARAVVATEDHRFYQDYGIDPISVARAAIGTVAGSTTDQGGATIAQQLAKRLYTPTNNDLLTKVEQVALAVKLDGHYTKDQILSMYLNEPSSV